MTEESANVKPLGGEDDRHSSSAAKFILVYVHNQYVFRERPSKKSSAVKLGRTASSISFPRNGAATAVWSTWSSATKTAQIEGAGPGRAFDRGRQTGVRLCQGPLSRARQNAHRLLVTCAPANLFIARRQLLRHQTA